MTTSGDKKQSQYHLKDHVWKASRMEAHEFAKCESETKKKLSRGTTEGEK